MPKLSYETVTLLDGDILVFKCTRILAWPATFKIDGTWVRVSTKCKQFAKAKEAARELYIEYKIRQKNGLPVFRLPDGTASQNLRQTFKRLMTDAGLLTCPRTGQNRTLYSFRHTYAIFALLNNGMDIHSLAIQMGTLIQMIERHYSHLTPRLRRDMLTSKRYDLTREEFLKQKSSV